MGRLVVLRWAWLGEHWRLLGTAIRRSILARSQGRLGVLRWAWWGEYLRLLGTASRRSILASSQGRLGVLRWAWLGEYYWKKYSWVMCNGIFWEVLRTCHLFHTWVQYLLLQQKSPVYKVYTMYILLWKHMQDNLQNYG